MKLLNFIWAIGFGLFYFIAYFALAVICFASIIFIPAGIQLLKLMRISLRPSVYEIEIDPNSRLLPNILWGCTFGWALALEHLALGILCCLTVVGIPMGLRSFKMMKLAYAPVGAEIEKD